MKKRQKKESFGIKADDVFFTIISPKKKHNTTCIKPLFFTKNFFMHEMTFQMESSRLNSARENKKKRISLMEKSDDDVLGVENYKMMLVSNGF
jgi:hypothetical protein